MSTATTAAGVDYLNDLAAVAVLDRGLLPPLDSHVQTDQERALGSHHVVR